jgi:hypothetical protein
MYVSDDRETETDTDMSLVPKRRSFEVEIAIANLKIYKLASNGRILAEVMHTGCYTLLFMIHTLINSIFYKEKLPQKLKAFIFIPIYKKGDKTAVIVQGYHSYRLHRKFYPIFFSQV